MTKAQKKAQQQGSVPKASNVVKHPANRAVTADPGPRDATDLMRVLLVEDNPGDVELICMTLSSGGGPVSLVSAARLQEALLLARDNSFDVALLDLGLPDSGGLETLRTFLQKTRLPCVVFTGLTHDAIGLAAINEGAQDVIVKGQDDMSPAALRRALRYAIERHRLMSRIESLTLYDEVSGLLNRRGFMETGRDLLNTAERLGQLVLLLFMDFDNFKSINDKHGHAQGDLAISDAAKILLRTFRKTDVIARVGGDEFAVMALVPSPEHGATLSLRLEGEIAEFNATGLRPWKFSMSVGSAWSKPDAPLSFEALLERADSVMYAKKRSRNTGS